MLYQTLKAKNIAAAMTLASKSKILGNNSSLAQALRFYRILPQR